MDRSPSITGRLRVAVAAAIATASGLAFDLPSARADGDSGDARLASQRVSAREAPRERSEPSMYLAVESAVDISARAARKTRRSFALERAIARKLADSPAVTSDPDEAASLQLERYAIDVSLVELRRVDRKSWVDIECRVRIAVSDHRGKLLSLLHGGATVRASRASFRPEDEAVHRADAIASAVDSALAAMLQFLTLLGRDVATENGA